MYRILEYSYRRLSPIRTFSKFIPNNGNHIIMKRQVRKRLKKTNFSYENTDKTPLHDPEKKFDLRYKVT